MTKVLLRPDLKRLLRTLLFLVCFAPVAAFAQDVSITGMVTSDDDQPLPGVYVLVKGTSTGAVTDADGKYVINAPSGGVLVFSFIGMRNTEIAIDGRTSIDIKMETDIGQLDEVVVVGYGTQKKSDLTGAVGSVKMSEIKNVPITRADQMLQGRVSGVQVTQSNAEPGGNISIRIRGTNSINSGNEPLVVVDGFPGIGNLNSINPNDIESIDVLKDASATAIYGSRGANGVIMVTTKRGKVDQNNIAFDVYMGVQSVRKKYDLMNARQFGEYLNEVVTRNNAEDGTSTALPFPTQGDIDALGEGTDWQDEIFRSAPIRNYQLEFNGGNSATQYYLSFNYFDQEGIIINSGLKRASIRFNLDRKISKKLNFSFNSQLSRTSEDKALVNTAGGSASGVVMDAMRISPTVPVYDATGKFTVRNAPLPYAEGQVGNPVAYASLASDNRNSFRTLLNAAGEYQIIEGLKLRVTGGVDLIYRNNDSYVPSGLWFGNTLSNGAASQISNNSYSWVNENTLTYDRSFAEIHRLNVVAGFSAQEFVNTNLNASVTNFFTDELGADNISFGSNVLTPSNSKNSNTLASFFARANYKLMEKYALTFTMRADGSSRFGTNNKWGYFPSAAAAWTIMEEKFMSSVPVFSDLKLRASYGITGNQEIGSYRSMVRYQNFPGHNNRTDYVTASNTTGFRLIGLAPASIPNADLTWESTESFDIGLDAGFFSNRLLLTVDFYKKTTRDLLLEASIPRTTGFGSILLNAGSVGNKGVEVAITSVNVDTDKVKWTSSFNISANRNEVLDLNGEMERFVGASSNSLFPGASGQTSILRVGEPIGSFYGYQFDGIWQTPEEIAAAGIAGFEPGDPRYKDNVTDKIINASDRVIIGRALPDFIYGLNNTISYGNFSLNFLIQGVQGSDVLNLNRYELESGSVATNKMTSMLDRWTGPGTSNTMPKANSTKRRSVGITDEVLEDGSFLRVKTISLNYSIPVPKSVSNVIKSVDIYVTGTNLITLSDYSGYDPEVNSFGDNQNSNNLNLNTDYNAFPASKSIIGGLRATF